MRKLVERFVRWVDALWEGFTTGSLVVSEDP
jgi:hypothetical protein